jgi:NADH:ubiquinone oxidoreductase subunit
MSTAVQTPSTNGASAKARPLGLKGLFRNPGLYFLTLFRGRFIGRDEVGNQYFERPGKPRARRWVVYAGPAEPSVVPPEWHAWLHHLTDAPLTGAPRPWQRPHKPNLTGTPQSYRPPGHDYMGGQRPRNSSDYQSWTPDQT